MTDPTHEAMRAQAEAAWKETRKRWRRRGTCSVCNFRQNLTKDGMVAFHRVYSGNEGRVCPGSSLPEKFAAENAAARAAYKAG